MHSLVKYLEPADMSGAELLALQGLAQTLLDSVQKLLSGKELPSVCPSPSASRRRRRQATLRKFYGAYKDRVLPSEDKAVQVSLSDLGPAPVPFVWSSMNTVPDPGASTLSPGALPDLPGHVSSNQGVALSDDDVATLISDLSKVQLRTYDCRSAALRARQRAFLQADVEQLANHIRSGLQHVHRLVAHMQAIDDMCALDNSPQLPELAVPFDDVVQPPGIDVVSGDSADSMRSSQPIVSPLGQPADGWGPMFPENAPQRSGHDCKQQ